MKSILIILSAAILCSCAGSITGNTQPQLTPEQIDAGIKAAADAEALAVKAAQDFQALQSAQKAMKQSTASAK